MQHVIDTLPLCQGWALLAVAQEADPMIPAERMSEGYIAQEIKRRTAHE